MSDPSTPANNNLANNNTEPRRRRWVWISLIGLLIVAAVLAGVVFVQQNGSSGEAAEVDELNFADVVITDLVQEQNFNGKLESVGGTGTLIPASQIALSFASPGRLAELLVQVGQVVQAGDVLARVDNVAAEHAVTTAELQLGQAAKQTDGTTTQSGMSFDDISVAQAQINLDVAQQALGILLNWEADADEIALLEANLAAAEAAYNAARGQEAATGANIAVSEFSVAQAGRQLADVQAVYDNAFDPARDWELGAYKGNPPPLISEREQAAAALQYALESLQIAQLNYDASLSNSGSSGSANAESQLLGAEQALASSLAGPTDEEITAAETGVQQAELNLQQAQLNREANELGLAQAELSLALAQEGLAGTIITAPMGGTVMSVSGHVGEQVGTAAFITLADLSQPTLEIFLDETNLDKLDVGSIVEVVFSALPADQFSGTVIQVDPQLYTSGGLSTVRALVQLDWNHDQTLPAGLTAAVNVAGLSNRIVRVFLPLDDEGLFAVGDAVTVELPDLTEVPGTVVFVPQAPTSSVSGPATFQVLVELESEGGIGSGSGTDDPTAAAGLAELPDETSVDVIFVSDAVQDVLAIPVSALVALLEGGYVVEVDRGDGLTQLVAVEVGFFGSNNLIAITSGALQSGDRVVVP